MPSAKPDHRFDNSAWQTAPFCQYRLAYEMFEAWGTAAARMSPQVISANPATQTFAVDQWLDLFAPTNSPLTNPDVIAATWQQGGGNLVRGWQNYLADVFALATPAPPIAEGFEPGTDVAVTPGKVVFRNSLIELIQYAPATGEVKAEPILIVPAWIMKYYVLDLSPHNSLIRYLVQQGYTVFCISWRNPGAEMRDLPFDAYRTDGLMAALDTIEMICGDAEVHLCGYCLGGTLAAIATAAMARDGDMRLASLSLLAAQTDFSEPGELQVFVCEAQIAALEQLMATKGYLDGSQMSSAFALLRSRDLIWGRVIHRYWLGEGEHPNDLMAWNANVTRMPARMHSEYLRSTYLRNDLAEERYEVDGAAVKLSDIQTPLFVLSTETDHVAPWQSVYKLSHLAPAELTFVLTSGGHNAGVVSEPGHAGRHFRMNTVAASDTAPPVDQWLDQAPKHEGSWWQAWTVWLDEKSGDDLIVPPPMGGDDRNPETLDAAPGSYVMER